MCPRLGSALILDHTEELHLLIILYDMVENLKETLLGHGICKDHTMELAGSQLKDMQATKPSTPHSQSVLGLSQVTLRDSPYHHN